MLGQHGCFGKMQMDEQLQVFQLFYGISILYYLKTIEDELSISGLLSTLGFTKLDVYSNSVPEPSTSVSIELWRKGNNQTYVKVISIFCFFTLKIIYMKPRSPTVDISRMVYGCKFVCTLEQFAKRSLRYRPLSNMTEVNRIFPYKASPFFLVL